MKTVNQAGSVSRETRTRVNDEALMKKTRKPQIPTRNTAEWLIQTCGQLTALSMLMVSHFIPQRERESERENEEYRVQQK